MKKPTTRPFTRRTLAYLLMLAFYTSWGYAAEEDEFDGAYWGGGSKLGVDFSRFNQKNAVLPGEYDAEVRVNNVSKGNVRLRFADNDETQRAELCLTPALQEMLDLEKSAIKQQGSENNCVWAKDAIPDAVFTYQTGEFRLDVDIPQALTVSHPRDYISPTRWQSGTTAAFVNYDVNYYRYRNQHSMNDNFYLGIRAGANIGSWALRHYGSLSWNKSNRSGSYTDGYQRGETYLQRDFALLQGDVTLGDFYTSDEIGESFGLRGIRVASDDRMLAPSQRSFAPVIRGIANTNANITIRQNGNIIYQIAVPAGPFIIDDLYSSGYNGDLLVEIQESDGKVRSFSVPFSNTAPLLRVGHFRYRLSGGKYRHNDDAVEDNVMQATLQYGLFNSLTINGGAIASPNYRARLFGFGLATPIGAFSADSTWAKARFPHQTFKGQRLHGNYRIDFNTFGTNIMLSVYRYSRDFYRLQDTLSINHEAKKYTGFYFPLPYLVPKGQYQLSINQNMGKWGDFYLSGQTSTYWGTEGESREYQIAYSNRYKRLGYQISLLQTHDKISDRREKAVYLSFSLPLGDDHSLSSTYSRQSDYSSAQLGVNGSLGDKRQWNYGLSVSQDGNRYRQVAANGGFQSGIGDYRASFSQDNQHSRQMGISANGSIVTHQYGVTLGTRVSDGFAIIHAKEGRGAGIESGNGSLDYFGNGIVPYVSPYSINYIGIDPKGAQENVDFEATETQIIPRANSIHLVDFSTHKNTMILFNLSLPSHEIVPMTATAQDEKGQFVGYVGQGGMLFAERLTRSEGRLNVKWGQNLADQCEFDYRVDLSGNNKLQAKTYDVLCTPVKNRE